MSSLNNHGDHRKFKPKSQLSKEKLNVEQKNIDKVNRMPEKNSKHTDDHLLETNNYTYTNTNSGIRVRKETFKMMTKTFEPKELVPFSQLRTLNQKELLHSLEENDKLGIVIKDQLKVAMIDMNKYQMMVEALHEYERLLDWIEEREEYERIQHRLESDRVVEYKQGMNLLEMAGIHPRR